MMFTHLTVGTNDLVKAHAFYNLVLPTLGYVCLASMENSAVWGGADSRFVVLKPTDGNVATVGNGVTIGFTAPPGLRWMNFTRWLCRLEASMRGPPVRGTTALTYIPRMYVIWMATRSLPLV